VADLHTKIELGKTLREFKGAPNSKFKLVITKEDDRYRFSYTGIDTKSSAQVTNSLLANERFIHGVNEGMRNGSTHVTVEVPTRESGQIMIENISLRSEKVVKVEPIEPGMNISGAAKKITSPGLRTAENEEDKRKKKADSK
jgi:hypothetical protein